MWWRGSDTGGGNVVAPPTVGAVTVTVPGTQLQVGAQLTAAAEVHSTAGAVLTGRAITWASANPNIATVSDVGVIAGMAPGTASITAYTDTFERLAICSERERPAVRGQARELRRRQGLAMVVLRAGHVVEIDEVVEIARGIGAKRGGPPLQTPVRKCGNHPGSAVSIANRPNTPALTSAPSHAPS